MTNDYNDPLITLAIAANLDFNGDIITVINKITGEEMLSNYFKTHDTIRRRYQES